MQHKTKESDTILPTCIELLNNNSPIRPQIVSNDIFVIRSNCSQRNLVGLIFVVLKKTLTLKTNVIEYRLKRELD